MVPFEVSFLGREDKALLHDLLEPHNQAAILSWIVEGARLWHARGLEPPDVVMKARQDYRHDQDQVARWLDERCLVEPGRTGKARALYNDYKRWAEDAGEFVVTETMFGRRLVQAFEKVHHREGWFYVGIDLREGVR